MSARKHRSLERRMELLFLAKNEGIALHCEGGMALANPDLQRLIKEGMLEIRRGSVQGLAYQPKRFRSKEPSENTHCYGNTNITTAILTEKGREELRSIDSAMEKRLQKRYHQRHWWDSSTSRKIIEAEKIGETRE